ncbi:tRNA (5-methylaminomethyl-2-thiouridine)(34)-methyltransferase MnmD [Pelagovum pacificum]|uniref:tRNA (5-methylaminomethyl-2-thiouridine)(34)-methyltransferase MnmD n=1 Tax=Pelagovum pacificum TaxID=2588711 RepID=A0A5C5GG11_9RHOB|nr:tRNA (5-methylaminomethyl-2-thiouridine)(34)-methyltransferase MnmD [Pelagovum pacificum]QQA44873.1 tRNA (5-methylaminomethyl-2-thiouridine)(34)-methyltransferase MnmD [Pelagovum pacificum]TNY33698.1 tRNA (5-methylaminomethyl-2-thiouridine)(34)-methyltransferase MnmD [Pelagovum pacificum]
MGQSAEIAWRDGTPIATRFDDPYFSLADGAAETRHVFLDGNDLPARFAPGFRVAELGFGTGLNLLLCWEAWRAAGIDGPITFTTFEAFPMALPDMARALEAVGAPEDLAIELLNGLSEGRHDFGDLRLELIEGDARETLPAWDGTADAWFLDGFSPAKNPELWQDALLTEVAAHTAPGGTAASYTAAGHVRRALDAAGFEVVRAPGYGRKWHMTRARLR